MRLIVFISTVLLSAGATVAAPPDRVPARLDDSQRVYLNGHIHPQAQPQYDQGQVDPSLQFTHLTLNFKLSEAQQADLDQFLADQQNPSSSDYHHWLTPEQYGARFGMSDADLAKATAWLESQGFTVTGTGRAKNYVTFDGTAATVRSAFRTEVHHYLVNGEMHLANAGEPSIPAALQPVVRGIRGLDDFYLKPRMKSRSLAPDYTSARTGNALAPDDFATIYDLKPLLAAGIDGTGQKLVVTGQTNINLTDLEQFRTLFNLPGQDPQVVLVPNTRNPGISRGDLGEADLDLEWSSAVARNASIIYVFAPDVTQSWQYAIDQNLAPVMNSSYGSCEADTGNAQASGLRALAQQANAQGITWFNASGDSGAADCAGDGSSTAYALAVDTPGSIPEVTSVGGTEFNEGAGTYWNATNDANGATALSYIPETSWNDSVLDGTPSSSGGGASTLFSKPSWQTGIGVPSDGARDVPDVSLAASADHDGYLVYSSGSLQVVGGTSASAQVFGGIAVLLNQYLVQNGVQATAGLGNINPSLYSLAQSAPSAFHDITTGSNMVTAPCPRRGCLTTPTPVGYNAGPGYDLVTGLGSVDAFNLVNAWNSASSSRVTPNIVVSASSTALSATDTTVITATVTSSNGTTPTGTITFLAGTTTLGNAPLSGTGGTATATLNVAASQLAAGTNNIAAQYNSDNTTFNNVAASVTVTVAQAPANLTITGIADGASFSHAYAPGEVLSIFGTGLATSTQSAASVPLPASLGGASVTIDGVTAPLYSASSGQLNVQIPYETPLNSPASLVVRANGQSASFSFNLSATAPAIFTGKTGAPVPNTSGNIGTTITLFVTGAGAMAPSIATGAAPASGTSVANLPKPVGPVTVTVGGINAAVQFAGIPGGLAGVMQINYQVPKGLTPGVQPVVVTVGSASSVAAHLTVLQ
jgi:uncharacterized protein (TIGR03437 family)